MNFTYLLRNYSKRQRQLHEYLKGYWGIRPGNIGWYEQALRHQSMVGSQQFQRFQCNERLELLGDSVLDVAITHHLFKLFPKESEGFLTKMRSRIVNRKMLSELALLANLDKYLQHRLSERDQAEKVLGNAFEALLGAMYLDRGYDATAKVVNNVIIKKLLQVELLAERPFDFKSKLVEWGQKFKVGVEFNTTATGSNHAPLFECKIVIGDETRAVGVEKSKKKAEQDAARQVCEQLKLT